MKWDYQDAWVESTWILLFFIVLTLLYAMAGCDS